MIRHQEDSRKFGCNLREFRIQKGLKQIDVAVAAGLNRTYISRIETGKARVTTGLIFRLVKGLEITSTELIKNEEIALARDIFYWSGGDKNG